MQIRAQSRVCFTKIPILSYLVVREINTEDVGQVQDGLLLGVVNGRRRNVASHTTDLLERAYGLIQVWVL